MKISIQPHRTLRNEGFISKEEKKTLQSILISLEGLTEKLCFVAVSTYRSQHINCVFAHSSRLLTELVLCKQMVFICNVIE